MNGVGKGVMVPERRRRKRERDGHEKGRATLEGDGG